jgi:ABC-type Fe3+-siderophore transport system permease subunit
MLDFPLSRMLSAFFSGYLLYIAGSLIQIVTTNPLASPATIGMNALVVLWVLITQWIITFFQLSFSLDWLSLLFILISIIPLSYFLLKANTKSPKVFLNRYFGNMTKVILVGLCLNLFVGAVFSFVQFLFMSLNLQFPSALWFGSFYSVPWGILLVLFLLSLMVSMIVLRMSQSLSFLSIGADFGLSLGVNIKKVQNMSLLLALIITAVITCFFGVFAFFGLVMPHIVRRFHFMNQHIKRELTLGALLAGFFMLGLDLVSYYFPFQGAELPSGMISSIIGSFIFLTLLVGKNNSNSSMLAKRN